MKKFHQFQHPPIFQGVLDGEFYFEGWYFKMVSINEEDVLALIPGIALNKKNKSSHAFIQILDGIHAQYHYISYPLEEFRTSKNHFFVKIRKSSFNKKGIHLDINEKNVLLSGDLRFKTQVPLPYHGFSPGVMGIFTYIPFMECNHGVVSMDHFVEGTLNLSFNPSSPGKEERLLSFNGGKGYIEKDWGSSFPRNWIWMQSNNFREPRRSILVSIATIPFLGAEFTGFLAVLFDRGKIFRFGTYNLSRFKILDLSSNSVHLRIQKGDLLLFIKAEKPTNNQSKTAMMNAPTKGLMSARCAETIQGQILARVFKIKGGSEPLLVFSDTGSSAGLEIMGKKEDF